MPFLDSEYVHIFDSTEAIITERIQSHHRVRWHYA